MKSKYVIITLSIFATAFLMIDSSLAKGGPYIEPIVTTGCYVYPDTTGNKGCVDNGNGNDICGAYFGGPLCGGQGTITQF